MSLYLMMALFPEFGKNPTGDRLKRVQASPHYGDGAFQNLQPTRLILKEASYFKMIREYFNKPANTVPPQALPSVRTDLRALPSDRPAIVWFGHSSYLLKVRGVNILVDPVFSGHASPVSFFGKAFPGSNVYGVADLPVIDVVLLTHDHYDHLDYKTIMELAPSARRYYTSLGVGSHLGFWGIGKERIVELDWWESAELPAAMEITATPARHFSGRNMKRNQTLWSSFVLKTPDGHFFLGGDSGYGEHFKTIGDRYGPFEIALLESGQYGKNWPDIHMLPEQTVAATGDLRAKILLPVHWGKFVLSLHSWDEPIRRLVDRAKEKGVTVATPRIGEPVILNTEIPGERWWESVAG